MQLLQSLGQLSVRMAGPLHSQHQMAPHNSRSQISTPKQEQETSLHLRSVSVVQLAMDELKDILSGYGSRSKSWDVDSLADTWLCRLSTLILLLLASSALSECAIDSLKPECTYLIMIFQPCLHLHEDYCKTLLCFCQAPHAVQVIRQALLDATIAPADVDNLEMHGTGTPLGDPIEVGAALAVLSVPGKQAPLSLSAVKSMLGHCEPAAGAASAWHMINRFTFSSY